MTLSLASTTVDERNSEGSAPRRSGAHLRVSLAAAIATAIVAIGLLSGQGRSARGDDKNPSIPGPAVPDSRSYQAFVSEIHRVLRRNDDRLIELVGPILKKAEAADSLQAEVPARELQARSAEARLRGAKLDRQSALDEFSKITSVQEKAALESEIKRAKKELERARKAVPDAMERLARINGLLKNQTASDLVMADKYTAGVAIAQLEEQKAKIAVKQAEVKKKGLAAYRSMQSLLEHRAATEKASSDELASQANWEHAKGRLDQAVKPSKQAELSDVEKRILSLVQRAIPIQDAVEAKRDQLVNGRKPDPALQTNLRDLTNQLELLVDQATGERAAARFASLKPRIQRGGGRSSPPTGALGLLAAALGNNPSKPAIAEDQAHTESAGPGPDQASHQRFAGATQRSLNGLYERLTGLAERALKAPPSGQDQLVNLQISVESSKADYQNARLTREVAEIAVMEYSDGIFPQDLLTVEGEISLARSDLDRTRDMVGFAHDRLAEIKKRTGKSVTDLDLEYSYSDKVVFEREEPKRLDALQQVETKKKLLVEYTKPRRLKQLQAVVEKARAEELAKQAEFEIMKARIERMSKSNQRQGPDIDRKRILTLIAGAVPIEEQIRGKLAQRAKAEKPDDPVQKEIQDLMNDLSAIVDEAEAVWSAGEFAGLKPRIEAVARRANPTAAK